MKESLDKIILDVYKSANQVTDEKEVTLRSVDNLRRKLTKLIEKYRERIEEGKSNPWIEKVHEVEATSLLNELNGAVVGGSPENVVDVAKHSKRFYFRYCMEQHETRSMMEDTREKPKPINACIETVLERADQIIEEGTDVTVRSRVELRMALYDLRGKYHDMAKAGEDNEPAEIEAIQFTNELYKVWSSAHAVDVAKRIKAFVW